MRLPITISPRIRMTPYQAATVAAGLSDFSVYNKMIMPTSYGDLEAEYDRLINGVAIWDVSVERQVQIEGPDADACAQYLTSRDLSKMVEGQGKYVAICDHDGVLLNDPVLLKLSGNRYWFSIGDSDLLLWAKAVAAEKGFDVKVTEPDVSPLAVQGPKATDLIAELFGESVRDLKYFWFVETELDGIPLVLCRSGWSKQGGYELFLQDWSAGNELWDRIVAAGAKYDIGPGAPNHVERVESGLLSYGGDNTPDSNPFEVGLARYVDVDCEADYIGKAALQKVAAAGPERLFVGLFVDATKEEVGAWPLTERTPVMQDGARIGTMSAIVHSHRLDRTIAIAQVNAGVVAAGGPVEVESPAGTFAAEITDLPFI